MSSECVTAVTGICQLSPHATGSGCESAKNQCGAPPQGETCSMVTASLKGQHWCARSQYPLSAPLLRERVWDGIELAGATGRSPSSNDRTSPHEQGCPRRPIRCRGSFPSRAARFPGSADAAKTARCGYRRTRSRSSRRSPSYPPAWIGFATSAKYQCAAVEMSFWQSWVMVTGCENVISTVRTVHRFDLRNRERHVIGGCKYVVAVYVADAGAAFSCFQSTLR